MSFSHDDLQRVRDEIRQADEALVRDLVEQGAGAGPDWERRAAARPAFKFRVDLGGKVAESKFLQSPERFRSLAQARDVKGLDQAITDAAMESAVLDRVRQAALACGGDAVLADRLAVLYRDRVIPETKTVQIRRMIELA
jgi:chorismate mutase